MQLLRHIVPTHVVGSGAGRRTQGVNRTSYRAGGGLALSSFFVNFDDLGAGQVNITPGRGGVSGTFTRAGATATTIGPTGLVLKGIAAGVARSYYDPTTLAYGGYLAEGARTNLALQSEDFGTTWTTSNASVSTNSATAPDGNSTADKIVEDSANSTHAILQGSVSTVGTAGAFTVFLKAAERTWARLGVTGGAGAYFDLSNGVVGTTASATATIQKFPNGWYRCSIVGTPATNGNVTIFLANADNSNSYQGDGSSGIYAWGAQYENNVSFPSTYIPTTTASVTRNKTTGAYTYSVGSAYTILVQGTTPPAASGTQVYISVDDGSANNYAQLSYNSSGHIICDVVSGGGSVASLDLGAVAVNTSFKCALAVSANDFAACVNGGAVSTDSSGAIPVAPTTVNVGQDNGAANTTYGETRHDAIFPARLPNAMLQALTS